LTAVNTKLLEKWKSFRKIIIRASIDGLGPVYNLIRYPGDWNRVSKNIIDNKKIIAEVTACLMPYNVYQLPEMEAWIRSIGSKMGLRFVMTPVHLNIANFPRSVKEELITLYSQYKDRPAQFPETLKALAYIERNIDTVNEEAIEQFLRRSNFQAEYRNNSWKEVCPELAKHFVNHPLYNSSK
jgi:sulfatase maturation enzyme AslB (radical SAM superfamily)